MTVKLPTAQILERLQRLAAAGDPVALDHLLTLAIRRNDASALPVQGQLQPLLSLLLPQRRPHEHDWLGLVEALIQTPELTQDRACVEVIGRCLERWPDVVREGVIASPIDRGRARLYPHSPWWFLVRSVRLMATDSERYGTYSGAPWRLHPNLLEAITCLFVRAGIDLSVLYTTARLRSLRLPKQRLGKALQQHIFQGGCGGLEALDLSQCAGRLRVGWLDGSAIQGTLVSLDLTACRLNAAQLASLCLSRHGWPSLEVLHLSQNPDLAPYLLKGLCDEGRFPRLRVLHLAGCEIDDATGLALSEGGLAQRLDTLNLLSNPLTEGLCARLRVDLALRPGALHLPSPLSDEPERCEHCEELLWEVTGTAELASAQVRGAFNKRHGPHNVPAMQALWGAIRDNDSVLDVSSELSAAAGFPLYARHTMGEVRRGYLEFLREGIEASARSRIDPTDEDAVALLSGLQETPKGWLSALKHSEWSMVARAARCLAWWVWDDVEARLGVVCEALRVEPRWVQVLGVMSLATVQKMLLDQEDNLHAQALAKIRLTLDAEVWRVAFDPGAQR